MYFPENRNIQEKYLFHVILLIFFYCNMLPNGVKRPPRNAPRQMGIFAMRHHLPLLILLLALAFAVGCVSPRRLFNLTPLGESDSRRTVNLWPLCYGTGDGFSVLWPIFDADKDGFAFRPLVFKEGKEWGVLWPASDFDEHYFRLLNVVISKDDGFGVIPLFWIYRGDSNDEFDDDFYQFLLGYKWGKNWGLFPFFHHGEDFTCCFPLFYHDRCTGKLITPISYFSPTFNYFTLAWWNRENGHFGFYPLFHVGKEGYRFLLWWKSPNSTGLFPIYISARDFTAAGPVWWTKNAWGVFPFCRFGEKSSYCLTWWTTPNSAGLFPIYLNIKDFSAVGPAWWLKGSGSWGVFPFFSYLSSANEKSVGILCHLLGGYEEYLRDAPTSQGEVQPSRQNRLYSYDWLCYLGKNEVKLHGGSGIGHHFRMWPFFDYSTIAYEYPANNAEEIFENNVLWGALWNYRSSSRYHWSGEQADECEALFDLIQTAPNAIYYNQNAKGNPYAERALETTRKRINEMCQHLELEPLDQLTLENLDTLANDFASKYPRSLVKNHSFGMLLDLIDYEQYYDSGTSFKLLWGALFRRESYQEMTESSVLWRAFRQVTTPTTTSREIFPFISYYHDEEDDSTVFSFAWRLFRRETSPEGNKLWLFFIPFQ